MFVLVASATGYPITALTALRLYWDIEVKMEDNCRKKPNGGDRLIAPPI